MRVFVKPPYVLPTLGPDRPVRLVGSVVGRLGEDRVMEALDLSPHQRQQRGALQPVRVLGAGDVAEGRVDVEVADRRVDHLSRREAGPADDHHHPDAAVEEGRLGAGEGDAVVGRADDDRVLDQAEVVQGVEDCADPLVERAGAGLELGHVAARHLRVRQVRGRQRVEGVADRGRGGEFAVGLEEADRHEPGLRRRLAQRLDRQRGDELGVVLVDRDDLVVADHPGVERDVLLADQDRAVAGGAQRVDPVLLVVVQLPAAVGEAEHAVVVAVEPGEQAGATAGAGRRGAEGLPEEHPLVGQHLDVRRRHLEAVGLDEAAGVVRVDVEDVGLRHGGYLN